MVHKIIMVPNRKESHRKNANRVLLLLFLEGIKMQLKLETSKYKIVKSFTYLSNTYTDFYYVAEIFLRTLQILNHVLFVKTL